MPGSDRITGVRRTHLPAARAVDARIHTPDPVPRPDLETKRDRLHHRLRELGSLVIGYSGGVDSVFLAKSAVDALGAPRVLAVTGLGPAYPGVQRETARACARDFGIPHLEIRTEEIDDPDYVRNPRNRCYHCKTELWGKLRGVAAERGYAAVANGANADDAGEHRPGMEAAREHGVVSPLLDAGLGKDEIRRLSREAGLPTWDQPASPCLASRIPHGLEVTPGRLAAVEAAEERLRERGYREFRVRHHGDALRLEFAPDELEGALAEAPAIRRALEGEWALPVVIDVEGYRRGSVSGVEPLVRLGAPGP